jgi:hypothetical protein
VQHPDPGQFDPSNVYHHPSPSAGFAGIRGVSFQPTGDAERADLLGVVGPLGLGLVRIVDGLVKLVNPAGGRDRS